MIESESRALKQGTTGDVRRMAATQLHFDRGPGGAGREANQVHHHGNRIVFDLHVLGAEGLRESMAESHGVAATLDPPSLPGVEALGEVYQRPDGVPERPRSAHELPVHSEAFDGGVLACQQREVREAFTRRSFAKEADRLSQWDERLALLERYGRDAGAGDVALDRCADPREVLEDRPEDGQSDEGDRGHLGFRSGRHGRSGATWQGATHLVDQGFTGMSRRLRRFVAARR